MMTEIGHNSIGVEKGEFLSWVAKHAVADGELKAARERRSALRKEIKAAGIELGTMDMAIKFSGMDQAEVMGFFSQIVGYTSYLNALPKGAQLDWLEDVVADPAVERAEMAGKMSAVMGGELEANPHDETQEIGQAWMRGWHDGREVYNQALAEKTQGDLARTPEPMSEEDQDDDGAGRGISGDFARELEEGGLAAGE